MLKYAISCTISVNINSSSITNMSMFVVLYTSVYWYAYLWKKYPSCYMLIFINVLRCIYQIGMNSPCRWSVLLFIMYWFRRRHTRTIFNSMRIYEIPTIFLSTEQHLIYLSYVGCYRKYRNVGITKLHFHGTSIYRKKYHNII